MRELFGSCSADDGMREVVRRLMESEKLIGG